MNLINRRKFLGLAGAASGTLLLPIPVRSAYQDKPLGVALLGLGEYSTYILAPALQKTRHCRLAGIVTGSPYKIPRWQKKYDIQDRNVYTYDTMHEIANNDDIDVVYIVTPTGTHASFSTAAANTGKHVWCEKPMAMTVGECQSIIDACIKNRVKLAIGYRMQHEPNMQTIMKYASSQPFGTVTKLEAQAGYYGGASGTGWRFQKHMGGGALYDMGVYPINGMRHSTELKPSRVLSAKQYTSRPEAFKEVDETTEFVLEFENGIRGYGKTSVGQSMNHLKITCESGHYELRPMQSYSGIRGQRSDGVLLDKYVENQQARQMDDDALSILENRPMLVPGEDGLKDIHIVQSILKSAESNEVIELDFS